MPDISQNQLNADYTDDTARMADGINQGLDAQDAQNEVATEGKWAQNALTAVMAFIKGMQSPL
jgi:hypothetical protein